MQQSSEFERDGADVYVTSLFVLSSVETVRADTTPMLTTYIPLRSDDVVSYSTVDISLAQALLGGTVPIKGVLGDKLGNLKVKPGTETGSKLRLRSQGIPKVNKGSARGDHYVRFRVDMPRKLTASEKEMILEIADAESDRKGTVEGLDTYIAARDTEKLSDGGDGDGGDGGSDDGGGGILDSISSMFGGKDEKSEEKRDEDPKVEEEKKM